MKRTQVLGIDLIRFLAATCVVIWHFTAKPFLTPESSTLRPLLTEAVPSIPIGAEVSWFGWVGVQIFFVISGVVIAFSAENATPRSFFTGRFLRLWPAMAICALICTILSLVFWHVPVFSAALRFVASLSFWPLGPWFSGQVWTLPIEIVFYAFVWILIVANRIHDIEKLAWALCAASSLHWLLVSAELVPSILQLRLLLLFHGCYFALGIALARTCSHGWSLPRILLVALCCGIAIIEIQTTARNELADSIYRYNELVPVVVWLAAVIGITASLHWREEIFLALGGAAPVFKMMGMVTYPLYLVHYQTGGPVFAALTGMGWPIWAAFLPAYFTALAFALLIARYAEPALGARLRIVVDKALVLGGRLLQARKQAA